MTDAQHFSRRGFLGLSAAAVAAPMIVPASALARPGRRRGANDRIVIGHIGLGGMGRAHLHGTDGADIGALCDVDSNHLGDALSIAMSKGARRPMVCKDFRYVLDNKDIDAVIIASPDHWHAVQVIRACEAGKDVYCEKPAARTVEECWAMIDAVKRTRRVVQVGSQGRSTEAARKAKEYIQNGEIGRVTHVECRHYESPTGGQAPATDPPPELDWDLWLGPHRWVPYHADCVHFNFRWKMDFGGGQIKDRGAHIMSVALYCLNRDSFHLVSVEAEGDTPVVGLWDCPTRYKVTYTFRDPDWVLTWNQPGEERIMGHPFGARYHGERGTLDVAGGDGGVRVTDEVMAYEPPPGGVAVPVGLSHRQDWEECMRTRATPRMDIVAGASVSMLCTLGNLAFRLRRKLEWDAERRQVKGDEQANRLLGEPCRGPWHL